MKSLRIPSILKIYARVLFFVSIISTACPIAQAAQIAPNPNPVGNTIDVTGSDSNDEGIDFFNYGTLNVNSGGTLDNSGTLVNYNMLDNSGTLENGGWLFNYNTLDNSGTLTTGFYLENSGTLGNSGTLNNYSYLINSGTLNNSGTLENGGWLVNENGATLTNSGLLDNSGALLILPGGTFNQNAPATYSGAGTIVLGGTLNNYSNNAFNITSLVLSGGVFNSNGTGPVSISTATVASGDTGTIQGTGAIELATADVDGALNISAVITGAGPLTKEGTGILTLSANNTYTGDTFINEGTLSLSGSITSPVTIASTGTLMGTGTITGNVTNNGTLAPGNSIGTLTVNGNYTHNAGAIYQVEVNPAGQSDRLVVSGTAALNGGTVSVLAGSGTYAMHTDYAFLTAGSVTGTFADVTSNLAFLTPSLSYDPTHVYLLLTRNNTGFADVALTSNQNAVASALDRAAGTSTGDMETVINNLLSLSASGARGAYDQMGGFIHTGLTGVSFSFLNGYMGTVTGRMGGFMPGGSQASIRGPMFASRTDVASDAGNLPFSPQKRNRRDTEVGLLGQGIRQYGREKGQRYLIAIRLRYGRDHDGPRQEGKRYPPSRSLHRILLDGGHHEGALR